MLGIGVPKISDHAIAVRQVCNEDLQIVIAISDDCDLQIYITNRLE